jgi:hypothetical protein
MLPGQPLIMSPEGANLFKQETWLWKDPEAGPGFGEPAVQL